MFENIHKTLVDIISIVSTFAPYFPSRGVGVCMGMGMGNLILRIADERINRKRKCWRTERKPGMIGSGK